MPAAAVIPAPIVYIRVVAVKKLVVGFLSWSACAACMGVRVVRPRLSSGSLSGSSLGREVFWNFYFEKNRVFQAGLSP